MQFNFLPLPLVIFFLVAVPIPASCQSRGEEKDISSCCTVLLITSSGGTAEHQSHRLGSYQVTGTSWSGRPIYKHQERAEFLFYLQSRSKGLWMIGPNVGQFDGGLASPADPHCVEDIPTGAWRYTDGSAWYKDSQLSVLCQDQEEIAQCEYKDQTEFSGGDLPKVFGGKGLKTNKTSAAECSKECEKRAGCMYWTWVKQEEVNCFLKKYKVEVIKSEQHISGSNPSACDKQELEEVQQEPKFSETEINGRFKITSLKFDERLKDINSAQFRELANTIEDDIGTMFENDDDLSEQADFTVSVKNFKKGSVVVDFKVNYVLKEAYIAIPFTVNPANISKLLGDNFNFQKGILFQRFLIASDSFNSSSPVDHCSAKGCSHKCDYDYDKENYVCTCPRDLIIHSDGLNCVSEDEENYTDYGGEFSTNKSDLDETTTAFNDFELILDDVEVLTTTQKVPDLLESTTEIRELVNRIGDPEDTNDNFNTTTENAGESSTVQSNSSISNDLPTTTSRSETTISGEEITTIVSEIKEQDGESTEFRIELSTETAEQMSTEPAIDSLPGTSIDNISVTELELSTKAVEMTTGNYLEISTTNDEQIIKETSETLLQISTEAKPYDRTESNISIETTENTSVETATDFSDTSTDTDSTAGIPSETTELVENDIILTTEKSEFVENSTQIGNNEATEEASPQQEFTTTALELSTEVTSVKESETTDTLLESVTENATESGIFITTEIEINQSTETAIDSSTFTPSETEEEESTQTAIDITTETEQVSSTDTSSTGEFSTKSTEELTTGKAEESSTEVVGGPSTDSAEESSTESEEESSTVSAEESSTESAEESSTEGAKETSTGISEEIVTESAASATRTEEELSTEISEKTTTESADSSTERAEELSIEGAEESSTDSKEESSTDSLGESSTTQQAELAVEITTEAIVTTTVEIENIETTTSSDSGIYEFDCVAIGEEGSEEEEIPLECKIRDGDKKEEEKTRTVYIVIDKSNVEGDITRIFEDNVRLVVRKVVVEDISPK